MSAISQSFRSPNWLRAGSVALVLACLSLSACKGQADAVDAKTGEKVELDKDGKPIQKPEAVPVEVSQVAKRPISASYTGTAPLEAPNESQVVAKASGV